LYLAINYHDRERARRKKTTEKKSIKKSSPKGRKNPILKYFDPSSKNPGDQRKKWIEDHRFLIKKNSNLRHKVKKIKK